MINEVLSELRDYERAHRIQSHDGFRPDHAATAERYARYAEALESAYAAGVREGVRQAREEVRLIPCYGPNSREMEFDIGPFARTQVLDVLDSL